MLIISSSFGALIYAVTGVERLSQSIKTVQSRQTTARWHGRIKDIETFWGRRLRTKLRPEKTVGSARDKLLCFLAWWLELRAWEWRISLIDDVAAVYWSRLLNQSAYHLL